MDLFTEVYDKTRDLLQSPQLHADWSDIWIPGSRRARQADEALLHGVQEG